MWGQNRGALGSGGEFKSTHAELKRCVFVVDVFIYLFIYFAFAKDRNTHTRTALC